MKSLVVFRNIMLNVAGLSIILIIIGTALNVFLRYGFNMPLPAVYESSELLMAWIVFGGLAYVESDRANIKIDFLTSRMRPNMRKIVNIIGSFLTLLFFGLITWQGLNLTILAFAESGHIDGSIPVPYLPFKMAVPIGGLAVCIERFKIIMEEIGAIAPKI